MLPDVLAEIATRRAEALARRTRQYPRSNPIASDLGPCARETVLAMTRWQERPLPSPELKARFERGNLIEDAVLRELGALGLRVRTERTPFEIKDTAGRAILRGSVDAFLEWADPDGRRQDYPLEVKSLDPNIFRRVETVEDFQRWAWMRRYPRQLWSYCYAHNLEAGFFLLDDCLGHWKLIPVPLDYEATEAILQQCEAAVAHRDAGTLPDFHPDPAVCQRCWAFGRACEPPAMRPGFTILADEELERKLERMGELAAAADEHDALEKEVKAAVKGKDGLVIGRWLIRGKEVIKHFKPQPAKPAADRVEWHTKIERLEATAEDLVEQPSLVPALEASLAAIREGT